MPAVNAPTPTLTLTVTLLPTCRLGIHAFLGRSHKNTNNVFRLGLTRDSFSLAQAKLIDTLWVLVLLAPSPRCSWRPTIYI